MAPASTVEPDEFNETFASGVLYVATPYQADPEAYLASSGLSGGCESIEVQPYSDPIFTGFVQVGTNCGARRWHLEHDRRQPGGRVVHRGRSGPDR